MATTQVVWNYEQRFDQQIISAAQAKLTQMQQEGKTDGAMNMDLLPNNTWVSIREWNSVPAAQEWIDFIQAYQPISATIIG